MSVFDPVPQHRTLSVMPTFQCTAACEHCGTLSSPREKTWLPPADLFSAVDQAADAGYGVVVFTGGEPTLAGPTLLRGIERAAARGLAVRVVTNAYWATSDKAARQKVADLVSAGLAEINFSTGDQHAKFVPLANVIRAVRAAATAGLTAAVMVELVGERTITRAAVEADPDFRAVLADVPGAVVKINESPWMPLSPSAVTPYPPGLAINRSNVAMCKGCDSILTTTTVQADGRIGACCGLGMRLIPELQLGTVRDTPLRDADRAAGDDFLKHWIRVEGPEQILAWAAAHDPAIEWEDMYAHRCQACLRLYQDGRVRAVIAEHHREKLADVLFAEWLLHHYRHEPEAAGPVGREAVPV